MRRFINSVNNAFTGIVHAFGSEKNMRTHVIVATLVVIAGVVTHCTRYEMIALALTITFVFFAELINTAVEPVVDLITEKYNEYAKIAKNVAAGAVLLAAVNSLIVGYLVFYRKLSSARGVFLSMETTIQNLPAHVIFASMFLVCVCVIIIKAKSTKRKGSYIHGGMPSGHTALAFALFAAMALVGRDTVITSFACIMAVLVAESRMETNVHTFSEVAAGAIIGVLITILLFYFANWLAL